MIQTLDFWLTGQELDHCATTTHFGPRGLISTVKLKLSDSKKWTGVELELSNSSKRSSSVKILAENFIFANFLTNKRNFKKFQLKRILFYRHEIFFEFLRRRRFWDWATFSNLFNLSFLTWTNRAKNLLYKLFFWLRFVPGSSLVSLPSCKKF